MQIRKKCPIQTKKNRTPIELTTAKQGPIMTHTNTVLPDLTSLLAASNSVRENTARRKNGRSWHSSTG
jgi:hypothetical protein